MTKTTISKTLLAVVLGSSLISVNAFAQQTATQQSESGVETIGKKIDSSVEQVGSFMDDSAITARVKAGLIDQKSIKSTDITVSTENKVVTLSGFVGSQEQAELAMIVASNVEGVSAVTDKLHVSSDGSKSTSDSVGDYADDAMITSKVKAKLLSEGDIASRNIGVETNAGIVQLTGDVKSNAQAAQVESITKTVDGVKSVKNDLKVVQ
ncbi:molecular chaperone OsmY [Klebsiella sp. BIGb0407]|uniref:molecular chaperone OsmY n=1 Tax=Klebsiella sp. BIGb0407 TaxID=2940603 RepID=UPI00216AA5F0|nr:molecular chaperone OsmY [Klebsiella sp. BIGb0407]MCS3432974.1 hyperosmotically inducible protein [Klebsiella sp. BIGb0407]